MLDHSVRDLSNSPMLGLRIGPNKEQSPLNNIQIITGAFIKKNTNNRGYCSCRVKIEKIVKIQNVLCAINDPTQEQLLVPMKVPSFFFNISH